MKAMLKLSVRSLMDHKLRFSMTTFAVLLGVSFVVASFLLGDGLRRTFDNIVQDSNANVDVEVRAAEDFEEVDFAMPRFDQSVADVVADVDGVGAYEVGAQTFKAVPVKAGVVSTSASWTRMVMANSARRKSPNRCVPCSIESIEIRADSSNPVK